MEQIIGWLHQVATEVGPGDNYVCMLYEEGNWVGNYGVFTGLSVCPVVCLKNTN